MEEQLNICRILIIALMILVLVPNLAFAQSDSVSNNVGAEVVTIGETIAEDVENFGKLYMDNPGTEITLISKTDYTVKKNQEKLMAELQNSPVFSYVYGISEYVPKLSASKTENGYKMTMKFRFRHSELEEKELDKWVDEKIETFNMTEGTDYEKIKKAHDFIVKNAYYYGSLNEKVNGISVHSPVSIQKNGNGVCSSYATLFNKFCYKLCVECVYITGDFQGVKHGWTKVRLDDQWYNIDISSNDPPVIGMENVANTGYERYDYFLKSDEVFSTHTPESRYTLPAATRNYQ